MSLRQIAHYNKIPDSIKPVLPPRGTTVSYRFLDTYTEHDKPGVTIYKTAHKLPPTSRVQDPETGAWHDVGLVSSVGKDGAIEIGEQYRSALRQRPQENAGYINIVIGESSIGDDLYCYLELASFNKSNPNRDEMVWPVIERADFVKEAADDRKKRQVSIDAVMKARQLELDDLKTAALVLGFNVDQDEEIVRDQVEQYALVNPSDFMSRITSKNADAIAAITHAIQLGVVAVDHSKKLLKWVEGNGELMHLTSTSPDEVKRQFSIKVDRDESGAVILEELKRQIEQKKNSKKPTLTNRKK